MSKLPESSTPPPPTRAETLRASQAPDAAWIATAVRAANGAALSAAEAAEQAANLERLLAALAALGPRRRFEDEPAGFAGALLRHRPREGGA